MREFDQENVGDIEVDLAEKRWQESDTRMLSSLAQEWETVKECPTLEEEDEDEKVRDDERRDASDDDENIPVDGRKLCDGSIAHLEVGEQRDGLMSEAETQLKQNDDRAKRALQKLNDNVGHPRV